MISSRYATTITRAHQSGQIKYADPALLKSGGLKTYLQNRKSTKAVPISTE